LSMMVKSKMRGLNNGSLCSFRVRINFIDLFGS
jgi:hypothetical protein